MNNKIEGERKMDFKLTIMNLEFTSLSEIIIATLIASVIGGIGIFLMARKAGYDIAWLAFIPILSFIPFFMLIKRSFWNVLFLLIPIVNVVFAIIWAIEIQQVFGRNKLMVLLILFVPGFAFIYYIYLGTSKDVRYIG